MQILSTTATAFKGNPLCSTQKIVRTAAKLACEEGAVKPEIAKEGLSLPQTLKTLYHRVKTLFSENKSELAKKGEEAVESSGKACAVGVENIVKKVRQSFNLDALDPKKTYIGLMYSDSSIAKQIKNFSKKYCKSGEVPMHTFGLSFDKGEWWLYESNLRLKFGNKDGGTGVYRVKANDWKYFNGDKEVRYELYELPLNKKKLNKHIGEQYGKGDIIKLLKASIFNSNGKQDDAPGLICSEYLALCSDDICSHFKLPSWAITPAHFKDYFVKKGITPISNA